MSLRYSLILFLLPTALFADEATGRDGQRHTGTLEFAPPTLSFRTATKVLPITELDSVRLEPKSSPFWSVPIVHRVELIDDQILHGELIGLGVGTLQIRTAWAEKLTLPRSSVRTISPSAPFRVVQFDRNLTEIGLNTKGAEFASPVKEPFWAGRLAYFFTLEAETRGVWSIETDVLRLEIDGSTIRAKGTKKPDVQSVVLIAPGSHRITLEWSANKIDAFMDDFVICSQSVGPDAPLRAARLRCENEPSKGGFRLEQATLSVPHLYDPTRFTITNQDSLVLSNGDELFGSLVRMDRERIEMAGKFARREWRWTELRAVTFHREPLPLLKQEGIQYRLKVRTIDAQRDEIVGAIRGMDADSVVVWQAMLGELKLPRSRILEIRPVR